MIDPTQLAPFAITGTSGTNVRGEVTATLSITNGPTYTCGGGDLRHATLALARRLVEAGYDPTTPLTVGVVSLSRIDQAV